jgi:hypothetical protein
MKIAWCVCVAFAAMVIVISAITFVPDTEWVRLPLLFACGGGAIIAGGVAIVRGRRPPEY